MIAALYVARGGCYFGLPDVDPWPVERNARLYAGPWPVIAHPPCKRWGRFWYGDPLGRKRFRKGDDGGCFAAALEAVRRYGGVLEHPAESAAWRAFGLRLPATGAGWIPAEPWFGRTQGWTCEVDQAHFGHRARKATWLYAVGCALPELPREPFYVPDPGGKSKRGMHRAHVAQGTGRYAARVPRPALEHGALRSAAEVRLTTCGALLLAMFVGIVLSILFSARRSRPRPPQPLSDSCASAAFRDQEEARRRA